MLTLGPERTLNDHLSRRKPLINVAVLPYRQRDIVRRTPNEFRPAVVACKFRMKRRCAGQTRCDRVEYPLQFLVLHID